MMLDWSRWSVVAHKDDTGFGRMASDARRVLGLGRHLVVPSERLSDHPLAGDEEDWLRPSDSDERVRELLSDLQGIIVLERHNWHPRLFTIAKSLGVRVVVVPMWEWFNGRDDAWRLCDLFVCPHEFARSIVHRYGWRKTIHLPWAIDLARFAARTPSTSARTFIHNAGLVDHDDRKGTIDTLRAFSRVPDRSLRLIVRMQKRIDLDVLDPRVEVHVGNLATPAELYATGDVALQPSKMEGIGFMVLEPVVSGLPTVTLDYPPMSEWVRQPDLRATLKWFGRRAFASQWIAHAHLRLPSIRSLSQRIAWCAAHDLSAIARANRAWALETFAADRVRRLWGDTLDALVSDALAFDR